MFYTSHLQGDGSLSLIWLAAHSAKTLKKKETVKCDIELACAEIVAGSFALRLSAFLVYGVHKIYNKQALFLLQDCMAILDRIMFVSKKKEKQTAVDLDLSQENILQVDDDQLMETLSLSADSFQSIEIQRGFDPDDSQLGFDKISEESVEVARRLSLDESIQPFALQDTSILPVPTLIDDELRLEEQKFSESKGTLSSFHDLNLENSMDFLSLRSQTKVSRKRKRRSYKASTTKNKYLDMAIESVVDIDLSEELDLFNPVKNMAAVALSSYSRRSKISLTHYSIASVEEQDQTEEAGSVQSLAFPQILSEGSEGQGNVLPKQTEEDLEFRYKDDYVFEQDKPKLQKVDWKQNDSFFEKTKTFTRSEVAQVFVSLINKNFDLEQEQPYGDILVV